MIPRDVLITATPLQRGPAGMLGGFLPPSLASLRVGFY